MDNIQEAEDFLERLDRSFGFSDEDFLTSNTVQKRLDEIFFRTKGTYATRAQAEAIFEVADITKVKFPEVGITKITFMNRGIEQTRFTIPFQRGLFGLERAFELYKNIGK